MGQALTEEQRSTKQLTPIEQASETFHQAAAGVREKRRRAKEPISIGLFRCPRCAEPLYEMAGDLKWCSYFECRGCNAVFHFEAPALRRRKKRVPRPPAPEAQKPKPRAETKLITGRRARADCDAC